MYEGHFVSLVVGLSAINSNLYQLLRATALHSQAMVKMLQAREWYVLDCDPVKHVTDDACQSGEFERLLNETLDSQGFENGSFVG